MLTLYRPNGADIVRGQTDSPLSLAGHALARERGIQFRRKGGIDQIVSSGLDRAVATAQAIADACPKAKYKEISGAMGTIGLGGLEGRPKHEVQHIINDLMVKFPNRTPPLPTIEQREIGIPPGESRMHAQRRIFGYMGGALQRYLNQPDQKILWVVHHRVMNFIDAWEAKGFPMDFEIDPKVLLQQKTEVPGSVELLSASNIRETPHGKWADWKLSPVNMESLDKLKPGIYLMRHSYSIWNVESNDIHPQGNSTGIS